MYIILYSAILGVPLHSFSAQIYNMIKIIGVRGSIVAQSEDMQCFK